jgi:putative tributyrin esterase
MGGEDLLGGPMDIYAMARRNAEDGKPFPKLYMWCGEQDNLIKHNDRYHALLNELGVEHLYETSEGNHSWKWWDLHIQDALNYLLG